MNRHSRPVAHGAPSFSQIVCGAPQVLEAFAHYAPARAWWAIILRLHGKPLQDGLPPEERARRVAQGFRFYAVLYRSLAWVFALLAPVLAALSSEISLFWAGASALGGLYLWGVSGLGRVGARLYERGEQGGAGALLAFIVAIVAFLSLFVAAASVAAHHAAWLPDVANITAASALFLLGVGSYFIEILYLASESS